MAKKHTGPCRGCGREQPFKNQGRGLCAKCYRREPDVRAAKVASNKRRLERMDPEKREAIRRRQAERQIERLRERLATDPEFAAAQRAKKREWARERYRNDPAYRERIKERTRLNQHRRTGTALPRGFAAGVTVDRLLEEYRERWKDLPEAEPAPALPGPEPWAEGRGVQTGAAALDYLRGAQAARHEPRDRVERIRAKEFYRVQMPPRRGRTGRRPGACPKCGGFGTPKKPIRVDGQQLFVCPDCKRERNEALTKVRRGWRPDGLQRLGLPT